MATENGSTMRYRRLGRSGVRVSEIGFGTWLTVGHGIDDQTARKCIRRAFELGVNFVDTADVYARGASEEAVGEILKDYRRQAFVLATKCYFPMSDDVNDRGLSRKHVLESIHNSLRRLRTDYVDLYQCHRLDRDVEMFELVRAMDDLIRQGKILYWGVSEWPAQAIRHACDLARQIGACPPASNQPEYSIAARRIETSGVQRACAECGLGMVLWSPLKQGLLSGKYSGGKVPPDSRAASEKMNAFLPEINREIVDRADQLKPIAERQGRSLAQVAINWLLRREAVSSVIIGATKVSQVEDNIAAIDLDLTPEDMAKIDELFPAEQFQ